MAAAGREVYCTLLLNDGYIPGAIVLARSLRDNGTKKQLAALVTVDHLEPAAITELKTIYDHVISVDPIVNKSPGNLYLMHRPDLGSTFTKIALWSQTQFTKIVYLDADMVALRAPDELFDRKSTFAAVPDIGWPDCFNSGLMLLTPDMAEYYSLLALANRGTSFDGADQGLLNTHFRYWDRLSFRYNCTPSGNYQYEPAYRHFQSSISMVHYVGADKPWTVGRNWKGATGIYEQMLGHWWAVYDRYYRLPAIDFTSGQSQPGSRVVQKCVKGEVVVSGDDSFLSMPAIEQEWAKVMETTRRMLAGIPNSPEGDVEGSGASTPRAHGHDPGSETQKQEKWRMASSPPTDIIKPLFPFGNPRVPPTRVYGDFHRPVCLGQPRSPSPIEEAAPSAESSAEASAETFAEPPAGPSAGPSAEPSAESSIEPSVEPSIKPPADLETSAPTLVKPPRIPQSNFADYTIKNAWDENPELLRDVGQHFLSRRLHPYDQHQEALRKQMPKIPKPKTILSPTIRSPDREVSPPLTTPQTRRPSLVLTDFPTETERPSLPVTPAPIRRSSLWGQEQQEHPTAGLPEAEGVPHQAQWDAMAALIQLHQKQSEDFQAGLKALSLSIPNRTLVSSSSSIPGSSQASKPMTATSIPELRVEDTTAQTVAATAEPSKGKEASGVVLPVQALKVE